MSKRPIILDTDPGVDDACAITVALNNPELDVRLISTMAGNVDATKTCTNALKLVQFFDKDVPVAKGAERPLLVKYYDASNVHGETGMDGYEFPELDREPVEDTAVEAIYKTLMASDEKITLVPTGAMTNIALLLKEHPDAKEKIDEIVFMGGSLSAGNVTSVAEFNMYSDPHAAQIVMESGLPITMIGLDVTLKAIIDQETVAELDDLGETGHMLHSILSNYKDLQADGGLPMHDVCAVFYLLHPEKVETKDHYIKVACDLPARGATIADIQHRYHDENNVTCGVNIDRQAFVDWFMDCIDKIEK